VLHDEKGMILLRTSEFALLNPITANYNHVKPVISIQALKLNQLL